MVSETESDPKFYLDIDSTKIKGNNISGWIKAVMPQGNFRMAYEQVDCVNMRRRLLELVSYSSDHTVVSHSVHSAKDPAPWMSIIPDSVAESIWNRMCALWKYGKQTGNSTSRFRVE